MNDNLDEIYSIVKGKDDTDEVMEKMDIKEMDSIVRSCGTCAFSKAKGLFTKSKILL